MSSNQTANDYTAATFMTIEFPGFGLDTLDTTGNMTVNSTAIIIGNSSVGYLTNSSIVIFGDLNNNSSMNSSSLLLGNITSNTSVNSSEIYLTDITANLLIMNSSSISLLDSNSSINCFINTTSILVDFITANSFVIGNSTVNISINSTTSFGFAGNSTVNTTISNNALTILDSSVPGNAILNSTTLFLGNSTVNVIINSTTFVITGNTVTGTINNATYFSGEGQAYYANVTSPSFSANISVGSNVFINTSVLEIGNSTVNTTISGNSLIIGNAVLNSTTLFLGNSTVNATLNSTSLVTATFSGTANNSTNFAGQGQAYYANITSPLFTTSISVGANVKATVANLYVGNSTVNTTISNNALTILGSATVGNAVLNSTTLFLGNSTVNSILNSTSFSGTANNSEYLGMVPATSYQLNSTLAANVATMTSNNSTNFAGQGQAYYANITSPLFTTSISIGNSTVNVSINSTTSFGGGGGGANLVIGNSTVNTTISNNAVTILGSATVGNAVLNSTTLFIGNSTVNTIINSSSVYPFSGLTTLAELEALSPNVNIVTLIMNGLSSQFLWQAGDYQTLITNDPGHGIAVAWSGDSVPGANGAWIRQYTGQVNFGWWGGGPNATANQNSNAFVNFGKWASYTNYLGITNTNPFGTCISVYFQPGLLQYDYSKCDGCFYNIAYFEICAYGVTFQNIYSGGANFDYTRPFPLASLPLINDDSTGDEQNWLIESTTIGGSSPWSVTTITGSQANNLTIGQPFLIGSGDTQYGGYPPNMFYRDYAVATAINATSGTITIDRPLRNAHLSTLPDIVSSAPCSAARIWLLTTNQGNTANYGSPYVNWNIKHIYRGMTVLPCTLSGSQVDHEFTGRFFEIYDWTGVGCSESIAESVIWENPHFLYDSEPDKLVWKQSYKNIYIDNSAFNFQSSSPEFLEIEGGKISGGAIIGNKYTTINNLDIDNLYLRGEYGLNIAAIINKSHVLNYGSWKYGSGNPGSDVITVDGSNVSYSNGAFTVLGSYLEATTNFSVVLGEQLYLLGPSGIFVGDAGLGIITKLSGNSNNLIVQTTLPYPTLPTWSNQISIVKAGSISVIGSSGCDAIEQSSWATAHGFLEWEIYRQVWNAQNPLINGSYIPSGSIIGQATSMSFNVKQASNVGGTETFSLIMYNMIGPNPPFSNVGALSITINTHIAGNRILTANGITGNQSGDIFTLNSTPFSTLPSLMFGGSFNITTSYTWANQTEFNLPIIEYIHESDCGLFRKLNLPI